MFDVVRLVLALISVVAPALICVEDILADDGSAGKCGAGEESISFQVEKKCLSQDELAALSAPLQQSQNLGSMSGSQESPTFDEVFWLIMLLVILIVLIAAM